MPASRVSLAAMTALARQQIMRIENFLAWEAKQEIKYEFDGFEPVAMAGGSVRHSGIQRNLAISIGERLRGTACAFYGSDMKVLTAERARYPDGQVICGPLAGTATFTTTPIILFEVVSPGYEDMDRVDKATDYHRLASVQRYVVLEHDRAAVTVMERAGDGWATRQLTLTDVLFMPEIGIEVPVTELYEGVL